MEEKEIDARFCLFFDDTENHRIVFHRSPAGEVTIIVGDAVERETPGSVNITGKPWKYRVSARGAKVLTDYLTNGKRPYKDARPSGVRERHRGRGRADGDEPITENQLKGIFKLHGRAVNGDYATFMNDIVRTWSKSGAKSEQYYLKMRLDGRNKRRK